MKQVSFSEAMKKKYPEWVVLISAIDDRGRANVMPAGWAMIVSGDPPMFAVAVGHGRYTHDCVRSGREFVIGLTSFVKQAEICSLLTCTTPRLSGGDSITEAHFSTITDVIILLRYVEINGTLRRGISVIKMRGSQHDKQIREFKIDDEGLHIGEPFKNIQNIILGIPTSSGPSESEQLETMFK